MVLKLFRSLAGRTPIGGTEGPAGASFTGPSGPTAALRVYGYGAAVLGVALMIPLQILCDALAGPGASLVFFLCAVIVVAWAGGLGPGLVATAVCTLACNFLLVEPIGSLSTRNPQDALRLLVFVAEGVMLSALFESFHVSRRRAQQWVLDAIRQQEILRRGEERYRLLFDANPHPMWVFDPQTLAFLAVNDAAVASHGYSREEFLAMTLADIHDPEDLPALRKQIEGGDQPNHHHPVHWRHRRNDGTQIEVEVVSNDLVYEGRSATVVLVQDVTARKRAEQQLEHQATHDALTGLPNRILLQDHLERSISSAQALGGSVALLLIDLDRFKEINDTFGHHQGDQVLQQLSPRLRGALRRTDLVARLGGDEFGIVLPDVDEAGAVFAAEKLLGTLIQPMTIDGHNVDVDASIGIALYPQHGQDAMTLLRRADVAMYAAKKGQAGHLVYSGDESQNNPRRLSLISALRRGIEDDQLLLHYQPKVALNTMGASSVEALIRWDHPEEGLIPPGQFIPLAEHTGLIKPLSLWALTEALNQCRLWHRNGLSLNVAVNLAPNSLQDDRLITTITDLLQSADALPSWLTVEVTESAMMADPVRAKQILVRLHDMGVKISIDDFGTGYSSLAYLKDLPVDEVKIDRSFVKDLAVNEHSACIVRSVIDLGHNLGLRVVAEGVEDRACLERLIELGCDYAQGYYFSRPLPASEFLGWMRGVTAPHLTPSDLLAETAGVIETAANLPTTVER